MYVEYTDVEAFFCNCHAVRDALGYGVMAICDDFPTLACGDVLTVINLDAEGMRLLVRHDVRGDLHFDVECLRALYAEFDERIGVIRSIHANSIMGADGRVVSLDVCSAREFTPRYVGLRLHVLSRNVAYRINRHWMSLKGFKSSIDAFAFVERALYAERFDDVRGATIKSYVYEFGLQP